MVFYFVALLSRYCPLGIDWWNGECLLRRAVCFVTTPKNLMIVSLCVLWLCQRISWSFPFFYCSRARNIWAITPSWCNIRSNPMSWSTERNWAIEHMGGESFIMSILRLSFAATVYHIWLERNSRIFSNKAMACQPLFHLIEKDIMDTICSWMKMENTVWDENKK